MKRTLTFLKNLFLSHAMIAGFGLILAGRVTAQTFTTLYSFTKISNGSGPNGLVLSGDTLYGTAGYGGSSFVLYGEGSGTVFAINTNGMGFTNLYDFSTTDTNGFNSDGANPSAGLILSGNTLYGTAAYGGTNGNGTVFQVKTDGTGFTNLYTFTGGNDGSSPNGSLILSRDTLYGTATGGGTNGNGTVFAINTDGSGFTNLFDFPETGSDYGFGVPPYDGLILSGDTLYGTATGGGTNGNGAVFAVKTDGSGFTNLYDFSATDTNWFNSDGADPYGGLILSGNTLYGTAPSGGTNGNGTVFAVNTDGTGFRTLHSFAATNGISPQDNPTNSDGVSPVAGLILSGNTLYGTAIRGGRAGYGTAFAVNTNGSGFTVLHSFTDFHGGSPISGLILSGNTVYGTTLGSLAEILTAAGGTVFRISLGSNSPAQGSLQVTITPETAVSAGAEWRINGGAFHTNGTTVTNLPTTNVTVSFKTIRGFATPSNQTATITSGQITTLVATYEDTNKPTLSFVSPKPNSTLTVSNAAFTVTGTAKDNVAVEWVYYQLNSNGWTTASSTNAWTNWMAGVTLSPGTNTVSAYAVDTSGNFSPTNAVKLKFVPSAKLVVLTNGNGTFTPKYNGALLAINTNYHLTANPGKYWIFSNWVASGSENFVSNNPALKFIMQSNLTLQANFVTNVFLAVQGKPYNGLFAPTNATRQQTNSGAITFTVTSAGVLSGKLTIGSSTPSLTGQFNPAGAATITTPRKGLSTLTTTLQLDFAGQTAAGSVTDGNFVAQVIADLDVFSATHKATNYQGQYTLIIPGTDDPNVGPFGTSYGTVTVGLTGTITFAGSLADGTSVGPITSVVSQDGLWPFYLPLYGGRGSLWGWNYFTNHTIISAPYASWINATNSTKAAVYRSGFTNEQAAIIGSFYTSTNKPLLSLTNAQVILEETSPPFSITDQITLASNNAIKVTNAAGKTNKLTLTIKTSGLITGSFLNPANAKQTIQVNGVLLQNQTNAQGYFLGTNQSGTFLLENP
jgi:uncharacterized repeat protein (TIGR03803 family)